MRDRIDCRKENGSSSTEDEESHPRFFGEAPPFVFLLEVDEGIDAKDQLGHREREDDSEQNAVREMSTVSTSHLYTYYHSCVL